MGICLVEPVKGWRKEGAHIMPPDLNEVARPLAVPSLQSCCGGETIPAGLPPRSTANDGEAHHHPNCQPVAKGTGGNGVIETKASTHATPTTKYFLTPALRATFAAVGATDRAYSFKEVLSLLKAYLYSKHHLFDSEDILYVNCKGDSLGEALKVDRFHYDEVRSLIAKNIVQEPKRCLQEAVEAGGCTCCVNVTRSESLKRHHSADGFNYEETLSISSSNDSIHSNSKGKTYCGPDSSTGSTYPTLYQEVENKQGVTPYPSVPGSSRQEAEDSEDRLSSRRQRYASSVTSITVEIPVPEVPESNSDTETVYSYQGYETAYCRNTECEDTDDASDEIEYEEYELASEDDDFREEMARSDDCDSVIEDVGIAFLAVQAVCEAESDEDFWADDSSSEDQSTDDDPELAKEKWDCLSCGVKNKPIVRYCAKCWQLRKNWLPERPKKKRRKPRPKKKFRRRTDSIQSEASVTENKESESARSDNTGFETSKLARDSSTNATDSGQETGDLVRSVSTASTVSLDRSASVPPVILLDQFSSQDSGISLSQELYTENSQDPEVLEIQAEGSISVSQSLELGAENSQNPDIVAIQAVCLSSKDVGESSRARASPSPGPSQRHKRVREVSGGGSWTAVVESSSRKRKSSLVREDPKVKRSKNNLSEDSAIVEELPPWAVKGMEFLDEVKDILEQVKFKNSEWKETVSKREMRSKLRKYLEEISDSDSDNETAPVCVICCIRPKNATIIHGRLSHQATCYQCAKRLLDTGSRCPVCRRRIHMFGITTHPGIMHWLRSLFKSTSCTAGHHSKTSREAAIYLRSLQPAATSLAILGCFMIKSSWGY